MSGNAAPGQLCCKASPWRFSRTSAPNSELSRHRYERLQPHTFSIYERTLLITSLIAQDSDWHTLQHRMQPSGADSPIEKPPPKQASSAERKDGQIATDPTAVAGQAPASNDAPAPGPAININLPDTAHPLQPETAPVPSRAPGEAGATRRALLRFRETLPSSSRPDWSSHEPCPPGGRSWEGVLCASAHQVVGISFDSFNYDGAASSLLSPSVPSLMQHR